MSGPRITDLMVAAQSLTPPPEVLSRLLDLVAEEHHRPEQVAHIVGADATMTALLLKTANHSSADPVGTIDQAVARVGDAALLQLVATSAASFINTPQMTGYGQPNRAVIDRNVRTALIAEHIAQGPLSGLAYTAGLMIDIGKLVLTAFVQRALPPNAPNSAPNAAHQEAECVATGLDHAEVGALIAKMWGFPRATVDAIRYHHHPHDADAEHWPLTYAVHVADVFATSPHPTNALDPNWQRHVDRHEQMDQVLRDVELQMGDLKRLVTS